MSNKGGVGKTHVAVNLAIQFIREDRRVLIVDADLGNANVDLRLGIRPKVSLQDFCESKADIGMCVTRSGYGFDFIAGSSGDFRIANINDDQIVALLRGFDDLVNEGRYTDIFFDLGAGISSRVTDLALVVDELIIVTTPSDIVSAYAALKACWVRHEDLIQRSYFSEKLSPVMPNQFINGSRYDSGLRVNFLVNQVDTLQQGKQVFLKILRVARSFFYTDEGYWHMPVRYIGGIPYIANLLRKSESSQIPTIIQYPHHPFSKSICEIANMLLDKQAFAPDKIKISFGDRVKNVFASFAGV
jgi:flagellar biosynthesis protein FlhG